MPKTTLSLPNPPLGGLYAQTGPQQLVFPLKHTEVEAKIAGNLCRVEVTQTFENPFLEPLEAIYVFPLPDEAAVDDMEIKIGDRIIKGNIKQREAAQQIYEQARRAGRAAGLLEQERDNVFTQALANIKPGESFAVTIRYTDSLKFAGGNYEFVFAMVVGPRYIPGTPIDESGDTDRVADAERISSPVIPPATRSGHEIGVTIEIDAGVPISDVRSPSHQLQIEREGSSVRVKLGSEGTIPNKDLVLRYRVAGDTTQATVLNQSDARGGHFAVYLIPALKYRTDEIVPKDVVFLIDTSGSQSGEPLYKCQELMRRFIKGLNPDDTFTIIDFASTTQQLSATPLSNTQQNRYRAINYINRLQAGGGTQLLNGIRAVLDFPAAHSGRLRSIVLLTDGYIGNENEVLAEVQRQLKPGNRFYSFAVGSSVNRFLLNRIAEVGRGSAQIVRQDEPTEEVAEKFFQQINNPVLTNIQISWEGAGEAPAIYPSAPPDLFAEQPLVLFGRKQDRTGGHLRLTGIAVGGNRYEKTFDLIFAETGNPALAQLWGRARIKHLMNQMFSYETKAGVEAVTDTALTYQLLSPYTAFVAVGEDVRVDRNGTQRRVQVPVELPEGVSYTGIIGSAAVHGASSAQLPPAPRSMGVVCSMSAGISPTVQRQPVTRVPRPIQLSLPQMVSSAKRAFKQLKEKALAGEAKAQLEASVPAPISVPEHPHLQIINVIGLEGAVADALAQHLQQLNLPLGVGGEIVFEFAVSKRRVRRIMLDEDASTLKETAVIYLIKQSLSTWRVSPSTTSIVRITLSIQF